MKLEDVQRMIKNRRSIFPDSYIDKSISKEVLMDLLDCANQAPTHKLTQPWRFKVFREGGLERLANELVAQYLSVTPKELFRQKKSDSIRKKVMRSGAVMAICMRVSGKIPEWEEVAAVACAVQNMWLVASVQSIGAYWSTPALIAALNPFLGLGADEKCIGLFYMGYHLESPKDGNRTPITEKIVFIED